MSKLADDAVAYLLDQIKSRPEWAYYFAFTRSLEMMTEAYAAKNGLNHIEYLEDYYRNLKASRPQCRKCHEEEEIEND